MAFIQVPFRAVRDGALQPFWEAERKILKMSETLTDRCRDCLLCWKQGWKRPNSTKERCDYEMGTWNRTVRAGLLPVHGE